METVKDKIKRLSLRYKKYKKEEVKEDLPKAYVLVREYDNGWIHEDNIKDKDILYSSCSKKEVYKRYREKIKKTTDCRYTDFPIINYYGKVIISTCIFYNDDESFDKLYILEFLGGIMFNKSKI